MTTTRDMVQAMALGAVALGQCDGLTAPTSITVSTRHDGTLKIDAYFDYDYNHLLRSVSPVCEWAAAFGAELRWEYPGEVCARVIADITLNGVVVEVAAGLGRADRERMGELLGNEPRVFPPADVLALVSGPAAILRQAEELVRLADAGGVDGHAELFAAAAADHEDPAPDLDCPADGNCYAVRQARAVILAASAGSAGA